jgi:hypothetical protein
MSLKSSKNINIWSCISNLKLWIISYDEKNLRFKIYKLFFPPREKGLNCTREWFPPKEGDYVPMWAISHGEKGTKFPQGKKQWWSDVPLGGKFPNVWVKIIGGKICPNYNFFIPLKSSQRVDI